MFYFQLYGLGCETGIWNCYVIDNNGYILLSSESNFTGKFFGEVEGDIMGLMVEGGIYNELTVFDLQGLCFKEVMISSDSELLMTVIITRSYSKGHFNPLLY